MPGWKLEDYLAPGFKAPQCCHTQNKEISLRGLTSPLLEHILKFRNTQIIRQSSGTSSAVSPPWETPSIHHNNFFSSDNGHRTSGSPVGSQGSQQGSIYPPAGHPDIRTSDIRRTLGHPTTHHRRRHTTNMIMIKWTTSRNHTKYFKITLVTAVVTHKESHQTKIRLSK